MSDQELIARLRDWPYQGETMANAAADRIEALTAKLATCEKYRDAYAECDRIGTQALRDLEAKLAKAVEVLRSFRLTCNENSFYNDCTFHFAGAHALSLRLNIGSDKAFIVADLEARRTATLAELEGGK